MTAVVMTNGQLALPPELVEQFGLAPGQTLEVQTEGNVLLAWKQTASDPYEKWRGRGRLPIGKTTDEYLNLIRNGDVH